MPLFEKARSRKKKTDPNSPLGQLEAKVKTAQLAGVREAHKLNVLEYLACKATGTDEPVLEGFSGIAKWPKKDKKEFVRGFEKRTDGRKLSVLFYGDESGDSHVAFFSDLFVRATAEKVTSDKPPLDKDSEEAKQLVELFKAAMVSKGAWEKEEDDIGAQIADTRVKEGTD